MGINYRVCFCKTKADTKSNKSNAKRNSRQAVVNVSKTNECGIGESILAMETVEVSNKQGGFTPVLIQYDGGAQNSLISTKLARKTALTTEKGNYTVNTLGGNASTDQQIHTILIKGEKRQMLEIGGLGVREKPQTYEKKTIQLPENWNEKYGIRSFTTPEGHLEVLLGQDALAFFPQIVDQTKEGDLHLCRSKITGKLLVMGNPERAGLGKPQQTRKGKNDVSTSNTVKADNFPAEEPQVPNKTIKFTSKDEALLRMLSHESLAIEVPKRCPNCRGCSACKTSMQEKTAQECFDEDLQRKTIKRGKDGGLYQGDYLWIPSKLQELQTNKNPALISQKQLEKKLLKIGPHAVEAFNKNMEEGFTFQAYRWTSDVEKEVDDFDSYQKHYIVTNVVFNDRSKTTPCRVVKDMSRTGSNKVSLNDCMLIGGTILNGLQDTLYHMRTSEQVAIGDIKKFYWRFHTPPKTWSLCRFWHRRDGMGGSQPWEECVIAKADFGARGAQSMALAGADKIIDDFITPVDPELGKEISSKKYSDDVLVTCPKNVPIEPKLKTVSDGLAKGGLNIKEWIVSGKGSSESSMELGAEGEDEGEKCLGFMWYPKADRIAPRVRLNYSKRIRGQRIHEDLKPGQVAEYVEKHGLTKRNVLCIQMSIFDITGLLMGLVMRVRLAYRKLLITQPGIAWDENLNPENRREWVAIAEELLKLEGRSWARSVIPQNWDGTPPWLVVFCDGSDEAAQTVAYVRFQLTNGCAESAILSGKGKVNPTKHITIPRVELIAHLMAVRLCDYLGRVINLPISRRIVLGDSTVVLQQLQRKNLLFDNWVAPRIEEIQNKATQIDLEFFLVPSDRNCADIGSKSTGKPVTAETMFSDKWLTGGFLNQPFEDWPISKVTPCKDLPGIKEKYRGLLKSIPESTYTNTTNVHENTFPEEALNETYETINELNEEFIEDEETEFNGEFEDMNVNSIVNVTNTGNPDSNNLEGDEEEDDPEVFAHLLREHGDWRKTIRVLAALLHKRYPNEHFSTMIQRVTDTLFRQATQKIKEKDLTPKMRQTTQIHDGIRYLFGRGVSGIGNDMHPMVSPKTHLGKAILLGEHRRNHMRSDRYILSKIRGDVFIPRGTVYLNVIAEKCLVCRRLMAAKMEQIMGRAPFERFRNLAPFESTQMDLAGPVYVFPNTGARKHTKVKAYILVTVCVSTHCVWLTLLEKLSADSLLGGIQRIAARFGPIQRIYSDKGTNLVGVKNKAMDETDPPDLFEENEDLGILEDEQKKLRLLLQRGECELITHSAKAPWFSGQAEVTVREMKKQIKVLSANGILMSHLEFETLLSQISCYLNNRPLILLPKVGEAITPNDLLHGMVKRKGPFLEANIQTSNLFERQQKISQNLTNWWEKFIAAWQDRMVELSKWRFPKPNPTPGDVVLILDRKIGGSYQVGEIAQVHLNDDGLAHVCTVRYSHKGNVKTFERPVRGLSIVMTNEERNKGGINIFQLLDDMDGNSSNPNPEEPNQGDTQQTGTQPESQPPDNNDAENDDSDNQQGSAQPESPTLDANESGSDDSDDENGQHTTFVVPKKPVVVTAVDAQDEISETDNAVSRNRPGRPSKH